MHFGRSRCRWEDIKINCEERKDLRMWTEFMWLKTIVKWILKKEGRLENVE
jgi:hypothetical protein